MDGPPVYIQKVVLSTELNSNMLGALLFGMSLYIVCHVSYEMTYIAALVT